MGKTQAIPLRGRMLGVSQEGAMLPKQEKEEADAGQTVERTVPNSDTKTELDLIVVGPREAK